MENERIEKVLAFLKAHNLEHSFYTHPEAPTIDIARQYWLKDGSKHCKNLFFRNHKGNRHYLVVFECHKSLDIHSLEHMLRQGKLSFASAERMERCLGLQPGSVSPLGLMHDLQTQELTKEHFPNGHRVKLFLDKDLQTAERISFHPNDNRATVVISQEEFMRYLSIVGNTHEFIEMY